MDHNILRHLLHSTHPPRLRNLQENHPRETNKETRSPTPAITIPQPLSKDKVPRHSDFTPPFTHALHRTYRCVL
jgi:hypothetical protein